MRTQLPLSHFLREEEPALWNTRQLVHSSARIFSSRRANGEEGDGERTHLGGLVTAERISGVLTPDAKLLSYCTVERISGVWAVEHISGV